MMKETGQFLACLVALAGMIMLIFFSITAIQAIQEDWDTQIREEMLAQKEESFSVVRRLTVIGKTKDDILFSLEGRMFVEESGGFNRTLKITIRDEAGNEQKHTVSLSESATYSVEELPD